MQPKYSDNTAPQLGLVFECTIKESFETVACSRLQPRHNNLTLTEDKASRLLARHCCVRVLVLWCLFMLSSGFKSSRVHTEFYVQLLFLLIQQFVKVPKRLLADLRSVLAAGFPLK